MCGAEPPDGFDFCVECGHSLGYTAGGDDGGSGDQLGEPTERDLSACPRCRVGAMRPLDYGHPQCESCGFMLRE